MKRRNFCRYVLLASSSCSGMIASDQVSAVIPKLLSSKPHYRWVILYWMPYDNDLVSFGEPIINMITDGTKNSDNLVIVQSDYLKDVKMRRRQIINGNVDEIEITGEDSSDISAFSEYLDWANHNFTAEHWAIIIVGHGGKINEISPDYHYNSSQNRTWMKVEQLATEITEFRKKVNNKVELLFFQNCNKATLEVIYQTRNCAKYTLASQVNLGAPNYYYQGFIKSLQNSSISGREAALAIIQSERNDMYHTLTLVDNKLVAEIPHKLSKVIKSIIGSPKSKTKLLEILTYSYFGEKQYDLIILLDQLTKNNSQAQNYFQDLVKFLNSSIIIHHQTGGKLYKHPYIKNSSPNSYLDNLHGLGIYLPQTQQEIYRYISLDLYKKVDIIGLYQHIQHLPM